MAWGSITGKPNAFAPEVHTHVIGDVTGLQTALDGKQASGSYLATADFTWAGLGGKPATFAPSAHSHAIADVTGLQTALDGKQAAGSYAAASHNHTASNITDFTEAAQDVVGAMVTAAGGSYNDTAGTITFPASGSDPWTYLKLSSDFVTSSATAVDVTGLAFAPSANTQYEFEAVLLLRTATATVGPRPGLAWPTGGTDGVADLFMPTSATAQVLAFGNINAALLAAVGGLPNTTQSWPARVSGTFRAGASPSGTIKIQLASETAGTNVTAMTGSYIKYRSI